MEDAAAEDRKALSNQAFAEFGFSATEPVAPR
jgi:hypothetical protein